MRPSGGRIHRPTLPHQSGFLTGPPIGVDYASGNSTDRVRELEFDRRARCASPGSSSCSRASWSASNDDPHVPQVHVTRMIGRSVDFQAGISSRCTRLAWR
jgi:hypothetical protein